MSRLATPLSTVDGPVTAAQGPRAVPHGRLRRSGLRFVDLVLLASLAVLSWTVLGVGGSLLLVGVGTITVVLQKRSSISYMRLAKGDDLVVWRRAS